MRSAVKGLTVIVAAYSIGTPFSILCQTFSFFTICVCHVPVYGKNKYIKFPNITMKTTKYNEFGFGKIKKHELPNSERFCSSHY